MTRTTHIHLAALALTVAAVLPAQAQQNRYGYPYNGSPEPPPMQAAPAQPYPAPARSPASASDAPFELYSRSPGATPAPTQPYSPAQPYAAPDAGIDPDDSSALESTYPDTGMNANTFSLLRIENSRGIRYVSGGIGEGERAELEALSAQFNLRILFAVHGSGSYLADVRVRILDPSGAPVLDTVSQGPWFLAALPPGDYTVEARTPEQTQQQSARIGGSPTRLYFYWN